MEPAGFALFEASIGRCGIAWTDAGIAAVQLPEACDADTRARLQRRCPDAQEVAPPPEVRHTIESLVALLEGGWADLTAAKLDTHGLPAFHRRVYEVTRTIPPGVTLSYGEVAKRLGSPGAARAVGQALGQNPFALLVPCHRVLSANGEMRGFSAHGGTATKRRLLAIERDGTPRSSSTP